MVQASLTRIYRDVTVPGLTKRKVVRAKDATIRTLKNGYMYIDADDPTLDQATRIGHSLIGGWRYQYDASVLIAKPAAFNSQPVFDLPSRQHYFREFDAPNLASYTNIQVLSVPQSIIDLADAFTLGTIYVWSIYDEPANAVRGGMTLFGASGVRGWSIVPKQAAGNGHNILWSTFPATKPVADVPFIIAWTFDLLTLTSRFYFNDPTTPVTSRVHTEGLPGGGDGRYWPASFGLGTNTASLQGKAPLYLWHDDSNAALRCSDKQRIGIFNDLKAAYAIP